MYGADGHQGRAQPKQRTQSDGSQFGTANAGTTVDQNRIPTTPFSGVNNKNGNGFKDAVPAEHLSLWAAACSNPYSQDSQRRIANAIAAGANAIAAGAKAIAAEDPNVPRDSAGPFQVAGGGNGRNPDVRPPVGSAT